MSNFRPKNGILGSSKSSPDEYYPDTLENFLRPRLDKVHSKMVDCISSGEPEAPHTQEEHLLKPEFNMDES